MTDAGSNPPDTTDAQSGGDATDTRDADIDTQLPPPDADASEELSQDDWREDRPCRKRLQLATHQGEYFVPPGGAEQAPPDDDDAAAFIGGEANYSHQIPASDLHASPLPENLWPDEEGEVRIHGLFVHNYAESPSGHVLVTAMVDFQPVEFKLEVFDATRESILSSTISTGAVVERDGRLFVYDIVIPQTNFEWGRLYDVEILVISIGEGNSVPLQRQERYSLVYGGWNALSGVEDICFDDPVESIPNETEDDVWGRGLSAFHEEAAAVFPIDRPFDPETLFREGLRLAPREKVTMGVSYRGLFGQGGPAFMLPHLDGRPLAPRWYITAYHNFHLIAHREIFEFEAPATPGLRWLYVSIWEDPFLPGENENRVHIEGVNNKAPGHGAMLPIIVE